MEQAKIIIDYNSIIGEISIGRTTDNKNSFINFLEIVIKTSDNTSILQKYQFGSIQSDIIVTKTLNYTGEFIKGFFGSSQDKLLSLGVYSRELHYQDRISPATKPIENPSSQRDHNVTFYITTILQYI